MRDAARFNPRARMGRDYQGCQFLGVHAEFQSTRPHGARPRTTAAEVCDYLFQSTRPHGARRPRHHRHTHQAPVSIHAPAWGATKVLMIFRIQSEGFNPRARMGRDIGRGNAQGRSSRFNPRARMGRDLRQLDDILADVKFQSTRPHGARRLQLLR